MLGRAWRQLLEQRRVEHAAPPRSELDITDTAMIEQALEPRFKVVVNCAGWTDVDGAEANRAAANRLNNAAVADLARRCARTGSLLVHYSSDYVFCGDAGHPYPVDAPTGPINAYGHSKLAGEQAIIQSGCRFLLIRTSWLYGPWGKNFVIHHQPTGPAAPAPEGGCRPARPSYQLYAPSPPQPRVDRTRDRCHLPRHRRRTGHLVRVCLPHRCGNLPAASSRVKATHTRRRRCGHATVCWTSATSRDRLGRCPIGRATWPKC